MLAMNYRGPFRVRADHNKPDPEILHPQDAIVRVTRSCICGSNLHIYHGLVPLHMAIYPIFLRKKAGKLNGNIIDRNLCRI